MRALPTRPFRSGRFAAVMAASGLLLASVTPMHRPASAAGDPVIAAAGDIACDPADPHFNGGNGTPRHCQEMATANQLMLAGLTAVLAVGDTQYNCAGTSAYQQSYDPTWGAVKSITYPVVGNAEYNTSGGTDCASEAEGYFNYFGSAAGVAGEGYYSFDIGAWHLVALNSNCAHVSCATGDAQERWLVEDLAHHPSRCTLAFFHHPRFSAGPTTRASLLPFWQDLYAAHADLVIDGHKHNYERLRKLDPNGSPDRMGIREFVVGTGGVDRGLKGKLYPGTRASDGRHFGILEMTLHAASYDWQFVAIDGHVLDAGSAHCVA